MPKFWVNPLATIEQYRISFNRNIMVVNDHFIKEGRLWRDNLPRLRGKLSRHNTTTTHHIQLHEKWYLTSIEQKYQFTLVRYNEESTIIYRKVSLVEKIT